VLNIAIRLCLGVILWQFMIYYMLLGIAIGFWVLDRWGNGASK
jgi:hypothetical protein